MLALGCSFFFRVNFTVLKIYSKKETADSSNNLENLINIINKNGNIYWIVLNILV